MKSLTTLAIVTAIATLSGCMVVPGRGDYRYRDQSTDSRYRDRDRDHGYYRHDGNQRWRDGDHAGGTNTPD